MTGVTAHLLLVEDEPDLFVTLGGVLRSWGYELDTAPNGETALARTELKVYDLIILNVMAPALCGLEVWSELQRRHVQTPILMLTAMSQTTVRVRGLCTAPDEDGTKPFAMGELQARIEALIRRKRDLPLTVYEFSGIRVDFERATLTRNEVVQALSERECQLLRYFVQNRGIVVTPDALMLAVWGWTAAHTKTLEVHILRLQQKVESDASVPQFIVAVPGGYRFTG